MATQWGLLHRPGRSPHRFGMVQVGWNPPAEVSWYREAAWCPAAAVAVWCRLGWNRTEGLPMRQARNRCYRNPGQETLPQRRRRTKPGCARAQGTASSELSRSHVDCMSEVAKASWGAVSGYPTLVLTTASLVTFRRVVKLGCWEMAERRGRLACNRVHRFTP